MVLRLMFDLFNFMYSIKKYYDNIDELLITELHILYVSSELFITSFANLHFNEWKLLETVFVHRS